MEGFDTCLGRYVVEMVVCTAAIVVFSVCPVHFDIHLKCVSEDDVETERYGDNQRSQIQRTYTNENTVDCGNLQEQVCARATRYSKSLFAEALHKNTRMISGAEFETFH